MFWPGRSTTAFLFVVCFFTAALPVRADNIDYVYLTGRLQTSSGFVNPAVLVGFNPQPEPPARALTLSDPTAPVFSWSNQTDHYELVFGLDLGGPVTFLGPDPTPFLPGTYQFSVSAQTSPGGPTTMFDVFFDIATPQGTLDRGSIVGFNPQPEPPGFGGHAIGFGFMVDPSSVDVTFRLIDHETGNQATFVETVPESSTLMLVALGGLVVACRRSIVAKTRA